MHPVGKGLFTVGTADNIDINPIIIVMLRPYQIDLLFHGFFPLQV